MNQQLNLNDFINKTELLNASAIPDNPFDLLGKNLTRWLEKLLDQLDVDDSGLNLGEVHPSAVVTGRVYIGKGAIVEPGAMIQGPCYIGPNAQVRHTAYIRGSVYVGQHCVVGHATEVKGSCFFDHAKAGHFAYVGDSILGRNVNLGAGTKLANLKIKSDEVSYRHPSSKSIVKSGLRKFGAIIGDQAQTGCNSVLSPGSLLLPKTAVYPCAHFSGTLTSGISKGR